MSNNQTECQVMKDALAEVVGIVTNDRNAVYGTPSENHSITGEMWSSFLSRKLGIKIEISGSDVCWMNILQKASRQAHWPKRDNAIDAAGYAANSLACEYAEEIPQNNTVQEDNSNDTRELHPSCTDYNNLHKEQGNLKRTF